MQQISVKNTRSISRPMIWLTLAIHLALGAFLYTKTTAKEGIAPSQSAALEESRP